MIRKNSFGFAVPVKLWVLLCMILGVFLTGDLNRTWMLSLAGLLYLAVQRAWSQVVSYGLFYGLLCLLRFLIRVYGFHSELVPDFHLFMFWRMTPVFIAAWNLMTTRVGSISAFLSGLRAPAGVILGMLVVFRFFPTMSAELRRLREAMRNRGLLRPSRIARHPLSTLEYILVPMLLHCLRIADELAVSALSRGIEAAVKRESYYSVKMGLRDYGCLLCSAAALGVFLLSGGRG
jgi:energy-coupling factor transport system permease protein